MKKITFVLMICCLGASFLLAASPAVGSWQCQSQGERAREFTLTFAEENGELVGTMVSERGERVLSDVKFGRWSTDRQNGKFQLHHGFQG